MPDGSDLGVTPAAGATTSTFVAFNPVFPSLSSAASVGTLTENQSALSVIGQLSSQVQTDNYAFNFSSGDAIKLNFDNLVNNSDTNPEGSDLDVQLLNSQGQVVADSGGTADQQAAFAQLTSSSGLAASNGSYYVSVSYADGTPVNDQSYDFQLYSGDTYNSNFTTAALIQPYDPNLFTSAADSITPATNLQLYTRTAALASPAPNTPATPVNIGQVTNNGAELDASSQTTAAIPQDNYTFNVAQSGPLKLTVNNTTNTASLDVQLLNSQGQVVADNNGTSAQQDAYQELTSGEGLQSNAGQYTLNVGFASGQLTGAPQSYNFQVNQGDTYNTVYKTTVNQPSSSSGNYAAGNNLDVYADSQAQLATRDDFNQIDATAASAIDIGWLKANTSSLQVTSQLTSADNADYYSFTLQQGSSSFNLAFNNQTGSMAPHVQILDSTGEAILADNQGTSQQKAAFAQLTSDSGLTANPGQYIVKVSYPNGASKSTPQTYGFQLYSGTSFTTQYNTTASAQTIQNLLLSGGSFSYSSASEAASLLTNLTGTNGANANINIFGDTSIFTTDTFV